MVTLNAWSSSQSYLGLLQTNVDLYRSIIPNLARLSPSAVMLVASQPGWQLVHRRSFCGTGLLKQKSFSFVKPFSLSASFAVDIMTHVAWRQSGFPPSRVIGAGCNLDSERLSHALDIHLNTHKTAWVIGELSDNKGEPSRLVELFTAWLSDFQFAKLYFNSFLILSFIFITVFSDVLYMLISLVLVPLVLPFLLCLFHLLSKTMRK